MFKLNKNMVLQNDDGKLPEEMRFLFWDTDFDTLNFNVYPESIAVRILLYGDDFSLNYLNSKVNKEFIINLVNSNREIDAITKNYWNIVLDGE
jgi:hypothetical protein